MNDYIERLRNNDSNFVEFDIKEKKINYTEIIMFIEALKDNKFLQRLNLRHTIDSNKLMVLYKSLKINTTLLQLDISWTWNNVRYDKKILFGKIIGDNNSLLQLDLSLIHI